MKIEIENYQKTYYVYMIKDTITKMVYIGSTSNLLCRIANHISQYKKGCTLCSSLRPDRVTDVIQLGVLGVIGANNEDGRAHAFLPFACCA